MSRAQRRYSQGAEVTGDGTHFRVFAPKRRTVEVVFEGTGRPLPLSREADGHFSGLADGVRAGALYRLRLDGDEAFPDPASRFQPDGPFGPSEVIDPSVFEWTDENWKGPSLRGQVIYEVHVGTYTPDGTYAALAAQLEELRDAGITLIELMPVAEFPGRFGWGYDGVDLYAPTRLYGRPDELRALVNRAHALGLGVMLDVVYNHVGPSGNFLGQFSDHVFSRKYANEWGEAIDFETEAGVRAFFAENPAYWIDEFHFDGLRFDATQAMFDASPRHVLADMAARARDVAMDRTILLVAESESQEARIARRPNEGGYGFDALWNDDFHHSARVAATGRREAYYSDTRGAAQELVSATKWGYLFQGQLYPWQRTRRGMPALDLPAPSFVVFLENHDQVANGARGARLHQITSPGRYRALTTWFLLAPGTPLLFQGQEFASSAPFVFFADHEPELASLVQKGRLDFIAQFPSCRDDGVRRLQSAPHDPATFVRCRLDLSERKTHAVIYTLHKDLLRLRREDAVFAAQRSDTLHGAVLGAEAFVLRFGVGGRADGERLVLVNLGADLDLTRLAEPLLAPVAGTGWRILFSSEDPRYGGSGTPAIGDCGEIMLLGHSTLVLASSADAVPATCLPTWRSGKR